jgi:hypothetical protein
MPRRRQQKRPPVQRREIRFVRGTYKGCTGWVDTANKTKRGWVWVVVDGKDYEEEVHARVWKISVRESHKAPMPSAEAAIQQVRRSSLPSSKCCVCLRRVPIWMTRLGHLWSSFWERRLSWHNFMLVTRSKRPLE